MIFNGNPGTGKTTVAAIVSRILNNLGFLSRDIVLQTTSEDFIGSYIGHTAPKTKKLLEKARGGIIFIDEAYTLSDCGQSNRDNFIQEALAEIIKEMENKKTIFIFSGYKNEMKKFIDTNPGIKSRIGYNIDFKDYTIEELIMIMKNKISRAGFKITDEAILQIEKIINERKKIKNFGNARMIDNLYDEILREHASLNVYEFNDKKLLTITEDSIKNIKKINKGGNYFA